MNPIPQELVDAICKEMGITEELFFSRRRFEDAVTARHICAIVLRDKYGWSNARIGWVFDRDRSTIHNSLQQAANLIDTDSRYKRIYFALTTR